MDDNRSNRIETDGIREGIDGRRKSGDRARDLHVRSGANAPFPKHDPSFEMEPVFIENKNIKGRNEAPEPKPQRAAQRRNERRSSERRPANREQAEKKPAERRKKRKKLDTSGVNEARGISHVERRRRQAVRDLVKLLSLILAFLLVIAAGVMLYRFTLVKSLTVSGSKLYGEAQLISLSGIRSGKSIFLYSDKEIKESMDAIPDIRTKSVKRVFPNRIDIVVEDVIPRAAILGANGSYTLISADGYVLSISEDKPEGMLEVRGLTGYGFAPNTYIDEANLNIRTAGTLALIKAIEECGISEHVLYIDLSGSAYTLMGLENGYTAVLGAVTTASDCVATAYEAYERFLPFYPNGGTLNVFSGSSIVDFTPAGP